MAQKYVKYQNMNKQSETYKKFYARAVYPKKAVDTEQVADFIQTQASVKHSDVIAVLNELGGALNHFLLMGERVQLKDIGTFKVGFSSLGVDKAEEVKAQNIYAERVLFLPEVKRHTETPTRSESGKIQRGYTTVKKMLDGLTFEETHDNAMNAKPEPPAASGD